MGRKRTRTTKSALTHGTARTLITVEPGLHLPKVLPQTLRLQSQGLLLLDQRRFPGPGLSHGRLMFGEAAEPVLGIRIPRLRFGLDRGRERGKLTVAVGQRAAQLFRQHLRGFKVRPRLCRRVPGERLRALQQFGPRRRDLLFHLEPGDALLGRLEAFSGCRGNPLGMIPLAGLLLTPAARAQATSKARRRVDPWAVMVIPVDGQRRRPCRCGGAQ